MAAQIGTAAKNSFKIWGGSMLHWLHIVLRLSGTSLLWMALGLYHIIKPLLQKTLSVCISVDYSAIVRFMARDLILLLWLILNFLCTGFYWIAWHLIHAVMGHKDDLPVQEKLKLSPEGERIVEDCKTNARSKEVKEATMEQGEVGEPYDDEKDADNLQVDSKPKITNIADEVGNSKENLGCPVGEPNDTVGEPLKENYSVPMQDVNLSNSNGNETSIGNTGYMMKTLSVLVVKSFPKYMKRKSPVETIYADEMIQGKIDSVPKSTQIPQLEDCITSSNVSQEKSSQTCVTHQSQDAEKKVNTPSETLDDDKNASDSAWVDTLIGEPAEKSEKTCATKTDESKGKNSDPTSHAKMYVAIKVKKDLINDALLEASLSKNTTQEETFEICLNDEITTSENNELVGSVCEPVKNGFNDMETIMVFIETASGNTSDSEAMTDSKEALKQYISLEEIHKTSASDKSDDGEKYITFKLPLNDDLHNEVAALENDETFASASEAVKNSQTITKITLFDTFKNELMKEIPKSTEDGQEEISAENREVYSECPDTVDADEMDINLTTKANDIKDAPLQDNSHFINCSLEKIQELSTSDHSEDREKDIQFHPTLHDDLHNKVTALENGETSASEPEENRQTIPEIPLFDTSRKEPIKEIPTSTENTQEDISDENGEVYSDCPDTVDADKMDINLTANANDIKDAPLQDNSHFMKRSLEEIHKPSTSDQSEDGDKDIPSEPPLNGDLHNKVAALENGETSVSEPAENSQTITEIPLFDTSKIEPMKEVPKSTEDAQKDISDENGEVYSDCPDTVDEDKMDINLKANENDIKDTSLQDNSHFINCSLEEIHKLSTSDQSEDGEKDIQFEPPLNDDSHNNVAALENGETSASEPAENSQTMTEIPLFDTSKNEPMKEVPKSTVDTQEDISDENGEVYSDCPDTVDEDKMDINLPANANDIKDAPLQDNSHFMKRSLEEIHKPFASVQSEDGEKDIPFDPPLNDDLYNNVAALENGETSASEPGENSQTITEIPLFDTSKNEPIKEIPTSTENTQEDISDENGEVYSDCPDTVDADKMDINLPANANDIKDAPLQDNSHFINCSLEEIHKLSTSDQSEDGEKDIQFDPTLNDDLHNNVAALENSETSVSEPAENSQTMTEMPLFNTSKNEPMKEVPKSTEDAQEDISDENGEVSSDCPDTVDEDKMDINLPANANDIKDAPLQDNSHFMKRSLEEIHKPSTSDQSENGEKDIQFDPTLHDDLHNKVTALENGETSASEPAENSQTITEMPLFDTSKNEPMKEVPKSTEDAQEDISDENGEVYSDCPDTVDEDKMDINLKANENDIKDTSLQYNSHFINCSLEEIHKLSTSDQSEDGEKDIQFEPPLNDDSHNNVAALENGETSASEPAENSQTMTEIPLFDTSKNEPMKEVPKSTVDTQEDISDENGEVYSDCPDTVDEDKMDINLPANANDIKDAPLQDNSHFMKRSLEEIHKPFASVQSEDGEKDIPFDPPLNDDLYNNVAALENGETSASEPGENSQTITEMPLFDTSKNEPIKEIPTSTENTQEDISDENGEVYSDCPDTVDADKMDINLPANANDIKDAPLQDNSHFINCSLEEIHKLSTSDQSEDGEKDIQFDPTLNDDLHNNVAALENSETSVSEPAENSQTMTEMPLFNTSKNEPMKEVPKSTEDAQEDISDENGEVSSDCPDTVDEDKMDINLPANANDIKDAPLQDNSHFMKRSLEEIHKPSTSDQSENGEKDIQFDPTLHDDLHNKVTALENGETSASEPAENSQTITEMPLFDTSKNEPMKEVPKSTEDAQEDISDENGEVYSDCPDTVDEDKMDINLPANANDIKDAPLQDNSHFMKRSLEEIHKPSTSDQSEDGEKDIQFDPTLHDDLHNKVTALENGETSASEPEENRQTIPEIPIFDTSRKEPIKEIPTSTEKTQEDISDENGEVYCECPDTVDADKMDINLTANANDIKDAPLQDNSHFMKRSLEEIHKPSTSDQSEDGEKDIPSEPPLNGDLHNKVAALENGETSASEPGENSQTIPEMPLFDTSKIEPMKEVPKSTEDAQKDISDENGEVYSDCPDTVDEDKMDINLKANENDIKDTSLQYNSHFINCSLEEIHKPSTSDQSEDGEKDIQFEPPLNDDSHNNVAALENGETSASEPAENSQTMTEIPLFDTSKNEPMKEVPKSTVDTQEDISDENGEVYSDCPDTVDEDKMDINLPANANDIKDAPLQDNSHFMKRSLEEIHKPFASVQSEDGEKDIPFDPPLNDDLYNNVAALENGETSVSEPGENSQTITEIPLFNTSKNEPMKEVPKSTEDAQEDISAENGEVYSDCPDTVDEDKMDMNFTANANDIKDVSLKDNSHFIKRSPEEIHKPFARVQSEDGEKDIQFESPLNDDLHNKVAALENGETPVSEPAENSQTIPEMPLFDTSTNEPMKEVPKSTEDNQEDISDENGEVYSECPDTVDEDKMDIKLTANANDIKDAPLQDNSHFINCPLEEIHKPSSPIDQSEDGEKDIPFEPPLNDSLHNNVADLENGETSASEPEENRQTIPEIPLFDTSKNEPIKEIPTSTENTQEDISDENGEVYSDCPDTVDADKMDINLTANANDIKDAPLQDNSHFMKRSLEEIHKPSTSDQSEDGETDIPFDPPLNGDLHNNVAALENGETSASEPVKNSKTITEMPLFDTLKNEPMKEVPKSTEDAQEDISDENGEVYSDCPNTVDEDKMDINLTANANDIKDAPLQDNSHFMKRSLEEIHKPSSTIDQSEDGEKDIPFDPPLNDDLYNKVAALENGETSASEPGENSQTITEMPLFDTSKNEPMKEVPKSTKDNQEDIADVNREVYSDCPDTVDEDKMDMNFTAKANDIKDASLQDNSHFIKRSQEEIHKPSTSDQSEDGEKDIPSEPPLLDNISALENYEPFASVSEVVEKSQTITEKPQFDTSKNEPMKKILKSKSEAQEDISDGRNQVYTDFADTVNEGKSDIGHQTQTEPKKEQPPYKTISNDFHIPWVYRILIVCLLGIPADCMPLYQTMYTCKTFLSKALGERPALTIKMGSEEICTLPERSAWARFDCSPEETCAFRMNGQAVRVCSPETRTERFTLEGPDGKEILSEDNIETMFKYAAVGICNSYNKKDDLQKTTESTSTTVPFEETSSSQNTSNHVRYGLVGTTVLVLLALIIFVLLKFKQRFRSTSTESRGEINSTTGNQNTEQIHDPRRGINSSAGSENVGLLQVLHGEINSSAGEENLDQLQELRGESNSSTGEKNIHQLQESHGESNSFAGEDDVE
ncbi:microtubule-associated protein futsch-like isoform X2 [Hyperolius riggenbachi]|uniref:microtubule-associated protein futsch-like isoform X2 n=1 Tax=Hyperolius riggenbachi TaxID=752182 RepID=UPI0035A37F64